MGKQGGRLRVGLLGYGFAGKTFHAPLINAEAGLELVAVASSNAKRVQDDLPDVRVCTPDELISTPEIDLVVVATPNDSHAPLARAALQAGKHIVVDKPFTLDLAEARVLVALAEACNRKLTVFHNRRWDSDFLTVRGAIERGVIGKVSHFESHFDRFRPEVVDRWRERDTPGSGVWFDLGPHLIDQALQLFGLPDRICASMACQRVGAATDDWAHVVLEFGACRAVLHASMLAAGGHNRFVVHGDKGTIVKRHLDQQEAQMKAGMVPGSPGWGRDEDPLQIYRTDGAEASEPALAGDQRSFYAGVAGAVRDGADLPVSPYQAIAVMAVLEAAKIAAHTGEAQTLQLSDGERRAWK
ncbi:MAG: oxidoreductase [Pseudomonadota bacterium]